MSIKNAAKFVLPRTVADRIRVSQYRWALRRFRPYQVRRMRAGFQFDLSISDETARSWYDRDSAEMPPEISYLAKHRLRAGATVFDCGAFQCLIAMILAQFVGAEGKVVAVEANPHNYEVGLRNRDLNDARNVEIVHAAVSDSSEPVEINYRVNGQVDDGSGQWGRLAVPSVSVDELTRRFGIPDVLFIDVEGFEAKVLRGGSETLTRHRPDCFIEMHAGCGLEKFGGSVTSITDTLQKLGYDLSVSDPAICTFVPFSAQSPIVKQRFFLIATGGAN
jgi:FkbM family methyltransferase